MGWETRGNKKYYYYKRRKGQTITSTYWGSTDNDIAVRMADIDHNCRIINQLEKEQKQAEKDQYELLHKEILEVEDLIKSLTKATYLISGLHKPKGIWRKLRKHPQTREEKSNELTNIAIRK